MLVKSKIQAILGFDTDLDGIKIHIPGQEGTISPVIIRFFSSEELEEIKERIRLFEIAKAEGKNIRNGGSEIARHIKLIETARESIVQHITGIAECLAPKESTRTTIASAANKAMETAKANIFASLSKLPDKALRVMASAIIGEAEENFTVEELPLVLAHFQVYGSLLSEEAI